MDKDRGGVKSQAAVTPPKKAKNWDKINESERAKKYEILFSIFTTHIEGLKFT